MNTALSAFDLLAAALFSVCDEMAAQAKARVRSALATARASTVALVLLTLWILIQGFRILTGQSREPMMALVASMSRNACGRISSRSRTNAKLGAQFSIAGA